MAVNSTAMNDKNNTKSAASTRDVLGRWDKPADETIDLIVYNSGTGSIILIGDRRSINHAATCMRNNGSYSYERLEMVCANDGTNRFALLLRDTVVTRHVLEFTLGYAVTS